MFKGPWAASDVLGLQGGWGHAFPRCRLKGASHQLAATHIVPDTDEHSLASWRKKLGPSGKAGTLRYQEKKERRVDNFARAECQVFCCAAAVDYHHSRGFQR